MYFYYAEREVEYLKAKDERLREVIEKIGHVDREVDTDLFSSVVHHMWYITSSASKYRQRRRQQYGRE